MSTLSQFAGGMPVTKAIVNACSTSGWGGILNPVSGMSVYGGLKTAAIGAVVANTLKTVLSITGRGCIDFFGVNNADATSRTIRAKITVDGTVVLDSTSAAIAGIFYGGAFIGGGQYNGANYIYGCTADPVYFNSSLLIEVASSLTETDKFTCGYRYKTF